MDVHTFVTVTVINAVTLSDKNRSRNTTFHSYKILKTIIIQLVHIAL